MGLRDYRRKRDFRRAREVEGAEAGGMPAGAAPQLATLAADAPAGEAWVHELKFDGYRVLGFIEGGEVRIRTRNGNDWTDRFPDVVEALAGLPCESAVVDGEVVVLDREGVTRFQRLQNALSSSSGERPLLYLFDLLYLDGWDVRGAGLEDRKALLAPLVEGAGDELLRYSDHVTGQGAAFFRKACELGVEGIISKRTGRPYRSGRGRDWLKVKCTARQELVVVGYTDPQGSRSGLGALLLGVHDDEGELIYAGRVGTGFDTRTLVALEERLSKLETGSAPVADAPTGYRARGVHWVRPELVAEVEFTEWTADGRIRHPSFKGLREDKRPEEVIREMAPRPKSKSKSKSNPAGAAAIRVAGVRVSSPDRVLWAEQGVTKGELVEYYVAVADTVLPRLMDRPLTLVRCPSGADGECFYQKNANESVSDVIARVPIEESGGTSQYMYVDGLPSLVALVQMGVLELHIWGSRRDRLDRPDRLVFDLDPDEGLSFGKVAASALRLREMLQELGLESFPKATGGKGLHLVVPITRRSDWHEAKPFAEAVARRMVAEAPADFTANMSKQKRKGKIFVDYLRNGWNATAIADYSTRARPGAPVAVPLSWDEVSTRAPKPPVFTVLEVPARIAEVGDPWPGFDDLRQSITRAALKGVGVG